MNNVLEILPWDSRHFGFSVAQIVSETLDASEIMAALQLARQEAMELVYWLTDKDREVSEDILHQFTGLLVGRRVTFQADLALQAQDVATKYAPGIQVVEYPRTAASEGLIGLGIAAGHLSRFCMDPRIPANKTRQLYEVWTRKSALRERADVVLVANARETGTDPVGMVTVLEKSGVGVIGLIAVHQSFRGIGMGRQLLCAAHEWMLNHGMTKASVVTQETNQSACRLYTRCGYQVLCIQRHYHFWPLAAQQS